MQDPAANRSAKYLRLDMDNEAHGVSNARATEVSSAALSPSGEPATRSLSAKVIQRLYKRHAFVFTKLGPAIFSRKGGE